MAILDHGGNLDQIIKILAPYGVGSLPKAKQKELASTINLLTGDITGITATPALIARLAKADPTAMAQIIGLISHNTAVAGLGKIIGKSEGAGSNHGPAAAGQGGEAGGSVATNRVATDAEVATNFQQNRQFWSSEPIPFNGNRVYQRNDLIDPNRVDPVSGKTNLELMQAGRAPLGPDGKSINLHHLTQSQSGAIAEVTQTFHSSNHAVLHMPNTFPSGINRTEFNTWRRKYWQNRANDF